MSTTLQTNRSRIKSRSLNTSASQQHARCKSFDNQKEVTFTNIELVTPQKLENNKRISSISGNNQIYQCIRFSPQKEIQEPSILKQNKIIASIDSISKDEGLALVNKSTLDEKIDKKKKHSFKLDVKKIKDNSYKFIKKKKI